MIAEQTSIGGVIVGLLALGVIVGMYFLPSIVAWRRHVPNVGSVAIVNTFLGWSLIGWVVAMAMAARDPRPVS